MKELVIGIDFGGTNIKAGVLDFQGNVVARETSQTRADAGRDAVIGRISEAVESVRRKAGAGWRDILGVGVGAAGLLNLREGRIVLSPNIPSLNDAPLFELLSARFPAPMLMDNDANVAAWGEKWVGAGRGASSLVMFTLGTGIGGGIILDDKVWRGFNDAGAELGHMTIVVDGPECLCGNRGCIEVYASATAIVRRFNDAVAAGRPSRLAETIRSGREITSKDIYDAAVAGDLASREIIEETGRYLGVAATNMMHILNPEKVIFAGGVVKAGEMLLTPIREEVARRAMRPNSENVDVVFAELGGDAGMIGAAGCALEQLK